MVFVRVLAMKKKVVFAAAVISVLLVTAVSGTFLGLNFYPTEVKADDSGYHPNILFEIPNEIRVEFYAASNEVPKFYNASEPSTPSYQLGEIVYLMLMRTRLRDGENPPIANVTISVSDDMGNVVWSRCIGLWGGGSGVSGGGGGIGVPWVSDAIGNYTAGVVFEGLIYDVPNDFSNVISIRIRRPGPFVGKVTSRDEITPINNALVEALVDGKVKANTTTDDEGAYNLALEKEGVYDVRVSASGYTPFIQRGVSTEFESQCLNFSLAPTTLSPNFNILWRANAGNSRNVAVDSQGNVIVASETEEGVTVVSKFDADGHLLWDIRRSFSGAWEVPRGLAVDSLDNILLLVGPNQFLCYDLWTVKLDPDGNHVWMKMFDSNETDQSTTIAVDSFDNVIIIGSVHGNGTSTLVKYTSDGGFLWSKTLPIYFEQGEIVVDSDNNIILGGITYSDSTGIDYYVAKLDAQGNLLWEKTFNSKNREYDYCYGISLDSYENIIAIGNKFTVKLDSNGNEIWLKYSQGKDLVVDLYDNIFSIRESFVEMFDRNGLFLGNIELTEDLSSLAIYRNNTLIVGGAQNVVKIILGGNSTAQLDDPTPQPKTTNPDPNTSPKATSAFISLEPNVAEVNQTVRINMFIEPSPPTSAEVFQGIVLTITGPDGHIYAKGPYSTDSNGSQYEFFTPVQAGNYTFQFNYPGQLFTNEKIEYAATDSPIATLTVTQPETSSPTALSTPNPILSPMASPASSPTPSQGDPQIPKLQSPTTLIVAASSMPVAVLCCGILFYFKKRNTIRE